MNNKTSLENIRRKTPATRKQFPHIDDGPMPTQQIDMLHGQVMATQQQLHNLQSKNGELSSLNSTLYQEMVKLRNSLQSHEEILHNVINLLGGVGSLTRHQGRILSETPHTTSADMAPSSTALSATSLAGHQSFHSFKDGVPPSPLAICSKLLSEDTNLHSNNLDHLGDLFMRASPGSFISPPPDANGGRPFSGSAPLSAGSSVNLRLSDVDALVYPIGQTNGIDPLYGDNINHIPFSIPPQNPPVKVLRQVPSRDPSPPKPDWHRQPRVLLVDDDAVCCGFGVKLLRVLNCDVVEAVGQTHDDCACIVDVMPRQMEPRLSTECVTSQSLI
jgi:osomolarity two-component system, response regulator SKN7